MSIHPEAQPSPAPQNCGLLHEIQDQLMEAQAELMDLAKGVLSALRRLKQAQFGLTMQMDAGRVVMA